MTQQQHGAATDEVVDAMNRTLQAEEAARERIAAAQNQALESVAAAREARHRIIAFPAADVEALQTAIRRLALRLIGGDSGA